MLTKSDILERISRFSSLADDNLHSMNAVPGGSIAKQKASELAMGLAQLEHELEHEIHS